MKHLHVICLKFRSDKMTRQKTTEDFICDDRTAAKAALLVGITFFLIFIGWLSHNKQI
jgi:hypothetical protein